MQLFILVSVNIVIAVIFYLTISLKLEKSADEFRFKKLRRQMDEIITEFNSTANRNISILEHRIRIIENLLKKMDSSRSINYYDQEPAEPDKPSAETHSPAPPDTGENDIISRNTGEMMLSGRFRKIMELFSEFLNRGKSSFSNYISGLFPGPAVSEEDLIIELNLTEDSPVSVQEVNESAVSEDTIRELVSLAEGADKYSVINKLYRGGLSIEDLSRYSGISAAEIRLVVNINNG